MLGYNNRNYFKIARRNNSILFCFSQIPFQVLCPNLGTTLKEMLREIGTGTKIAITVIGKLKNWVLEREIEGIIFSLKKRWLKKDILALFKYLRGSHMEQKIYFLLLLCAGYGILDLSYRKQILT